MKSQSSFFSFAIVSVFILVSLLVVRKEMIASTVTAVSHRPGSAFANRPEFVLETPAPMETSANPIKTPAQVVAVTPSVSSKSVLSDPPSPQSTPTKLDHQIDAFSLQAEKIKQSIVTERIKEQLNDPSLSEGKRDEYFARIRQLIKLQQQVMRLKLDRIDGKMESES